MRRVNEPTDSTTPELRTRRLRLRAFEPGDVDAVHGIFSDAETLRYWSGDPVAGHDEARDLLAREIELGLSPDCVNWGIALVEGGTLVGKITLFALSRRNRRAELGYILDRRHWGRGLMSEAMATVLAYAFDTLDLHRLEADTDPENAASLALLEKFGFTREGHLRERWYVQGAWADSVMLGLLARDYRNRRR